MLTDKKRKRSSSINSEIPNLIGQEVGNGAFGKVSTIIDHPDKVVKKVSLRGHDGKVDDGAMVSFRIERSFALKMMKSQIPGVVSNPWEPEVTYDEYGVPLYGYLFMFREERDISEGSFNYGEIISIFRQIMEALVSLNERGIGHLDIKPKNILASGSGEKIRARLCDFGLACLPGPGTKMYNPRQYVVTRWYRPPEAFKIGNPFDWHKVDIYALGVSILELVCGHPLSEDLFLHFEEDVRMRRHRECADKYYKNILLTKSNLTIVLNGVMNERVSHASEKRGEEHIRMIFDLLMKMMSFDPNDRPTAEKALMHAIFNTDDNESPKGVNELRVQ